MEKIKNMQQLQSKKKEIEMEQNALLEKIRNNWIQLKDSLTPANIVKESLGNMLYHQPEQQTYREHPLKSSFTYAVALLAENLADKTFEKVKAIFKKTMFIKFNNSYSKKHV